MGYNTEHYSTSGYNEDTEKLTRYERGEGFTADFPWALFGAGKAGVKFDITIDEDVDINELFGYEQGNAERNIIAVGNAEID